MPPDNRTLAIDPGLSGGYALFADAWLVTVGDLPRIGDGSQARLSAAVFANLIFTHAPSMAVVEIVAAMPRQGVSSTFRFGRACGAIEGVLAALDVPVHYVSPGKWKGHFRIAGKLDGGAEMARQRALELWPGCAALFARKKDHNRAEAALIGKYFVETQQSLRKAA